MTDATIESRELIEDFANEALDSLLGLPAQLTAFRQDATCGDPINAVFRAVHSIKGNAGFFGFAVIKSFAHTLENTLDRIRQLELGLTEELERAVVESFDELAELIGSVLENRLPDEPPPRCEELLARIAELAVASPVAAGATPEEQLLHDLTRLANEARQAAGGSAWGDRLDHVVRDYRAAIGQEETVAAPVVDDGESPRALMELPWTIAGEDLSAGVRSVCELFVAFDEQRYSDQVSNDFITAAGELANWAAAHQAPELATALQHAVVDYRKILDSPLDVDALLLSVIWDQIRPELIAFRRRFVSDAAPTAAQAAPASAAPVAPIPAGEAAATDKKSASDAGKSRLIRVKEERLDEFLKHVSSLFITGELFKDLHARLGTAIEDGEQKHLSSLTDELRQINQSFAVQASSLQESLVSLRMVPVGTLFAKFPRMARTLAQQLGKKVDIHLSGEEVEIDKSLIEDLDAPLTHMIRNVMDHAIEAPDARLARGAAEVGNLWLRAEKTRTHIRVYVQDDGRGIDPRKLRSKAVEKGMLTQAQAEALSDDEAIRLIFDAGFSTAEKLTEVSGRGVGMDVVRTKILEHNGDIQVESTVNVGTTFRIDIPQREAVLVIDGLMVREAEQNFVVPFEHILEISELQAENIKPVHGSRVAIVRNTTHPAVRLGDVLNLDLSEAETSEPRQGIVVGCKHGTLCLLADRLLGHRQVVVNSLGEVLPGLERIAGVAQLGGGRMALVLAIPEIVRSQHRQRV
ncbi:MAG: chemotaxis protein CheA [Pirellulales bacterium]|nr:chemotaxis protein CheA [Pirellulales bacterium]